MDRFSLRSIAFSLLFLGPLFLNGCSGTASLPDVAEQSSLGSFQGSVFGGHAPIVGAHVFVLEATSNGTAPAGYGGAAKSLLLGTGNSQYPESLDATSAATNGLYYVTTDSTGNFNISGDYTCDAGQPVYLYAASGASSSAGAVAIAASAAVLASGSSYTVTFVNSGNNALVAGEGVLLTGLTGAKYSLLNGTTQTVLAAALTASTFEVTVTDAGLGTDPSTTGTATPVNPAIVNLALLGNCPTAAPFNLASTISFVYMNEVSTVATAFSMGGFGKDGLHIGSSGTNRLGLQNAATNAATMYDIQGSTVGTGTSGDAHVAQAATPGGNGTVPQAEIDTLGNILASCVDSANYSTASLAAESTQCSTLFKNATSNGIASGTTGAGTVPIDTATAAFNIAHYPGANVAALYALPTGNVPFIPQLTGSTPPNDFTVAVVYKNVNTPQGIALDGSGNAYVGTNATSSYITELSPIGKVKATSPAAGNGFDSVAVDSTGNVWATAISSNALYGFGSGLATLTGSPFSSWNTNGVVISLNAPSSVATDNSGYVYIADGGNSGQLVVKVTSAGAIVAPISNGCLTRVTQIALDASANIWASINSSNDACRVTNPGGASSFTTGGFNGPGSLAIDGGGNAWIPAGAQTNLFKISTTGGATSYGVVNNQAQGGLSAPIAVAIDGASNVWVISNNDIAEFTSAGAPVSGNTGYQTGSLSTPGYVAIDISGDVWVTNKGASTVMELIGAGSPVGTLSALKPGVQP